MDASLVADYCAAFRESGMPALAFARRYLSMWPFRARAILDRIGSWPSSEPELRALQQIA